MLDVGIGIAMGMPPGAKTLVQVTMDGLTEAFGSMLLEAVPDMVQFTEPTQPPSDPHPEPVDGGVNDGNSLPGGTNIGPADPGETGGGGGKPLGPPLSSSPDGPAGPGAAVGGGAKPLRPPISSSPDGPAGPGETGGGGRSLGPPRPVCLTARPPLEKAVAAAADWQFTAAPAR